MWLLLTINSNERRHWLSFIIWCLMSASWYGMGWGVLTVVLYCHSLFGCHIAGSDVAPGFHLWVLVVFVVVAAVSLCVSIHSCLSWGICCCLGGHHHCLGSQTMTNNRFKSIIRHLVATSLSATWHLGCVSVERKESDDLLCMVTTLGVVTVRWRCVVGVVGRASWMIVVAEKEHCGLLMVPNLSNPQHN